jgi:ABC-type sugar transport system ATPase subunit
MPVLRLEGVEKTFAGGHVALAAVDLEVQEGELMVLLGPSGCGKSTLLRIVAGIETPTRGRVFLGKREVTEIPPQKRDVAMVFQNYALYPHMSVRDNLGFGLRMRRVARPQIDQRVREVAESLGITDLLERKPSQLSGGQRQRVALGRAIARNARVFLLDEPLSNLDVQLRVHTRIEIARLHRELRVPMLYVTHDQEEAMTLGDRVSVMHEGRLLQVGTPLEIYTRPTTRFVASFVGSPRMNLIPARLVAHPNRAPRLTFLGATVELPSPAPAAWADAAPPQAGPNAPGEIDITVGIRPEDIVMTSVSEADLQARVDVVEPLGRETLLHVVPDGNAPEPLRVLAPGAVPTQTGATVGLHFHRDRFHYFDARSGVRLPDGVPAEAESGRRNAGGKH